MNITEIREWTLYIGCLLAIPFAIWFACAQAKHEDAWSRSKKLQEKKALFEIEQEEKAFEEMRNRT